MQGFGTERWALGFLLCFAAVSALMLATFASSQLLRRHSVIDVAWGPGFVLVAATSFGWSSGHGATSTRVLLLAMTAAWGLRLGSYIALRQRGAGEDPRYVALLDRAQKKSSRTSRNLLALRKIYLLQGITILLISAPVHVGMYEGRGPTVVSWIGVGVWAVGICVEAIGDFQLARFKADPHNKGHIMDRGLWSWTRHPNYFGDACVWWGLFLVGGSSWPGWLTVAAPIAMNVLLARGTGKATLEKQMRDRPGFEEYVNSTSGFFPLPPQLTRALSRSARARRS